MQGTVPGMNFASGVPVSGAPAVVVDLPEPWPGCGALGRQCYYVYGLWGTRESTDALADWFAAISALNFDRLRWIQDVLNAARP